jgi:hypothetical protein
MKSLLYCSCVLSAMFLIGCGGAKAPPPPKIEATTTTLKSRLESVAQSGFLGSAAAGMQQAIQKLPADKSADLLKDYDELEKANSPAEVKTIAKRMADKL